MHRRKFMRAGAATMAGSPGGVSALYSGINRFQKMHGPGTGVCARADNASAVGGHFT